MGLLYSRSYPPLHNQSKNDVIVESVAAEGGGLSVTENCNSVADFINANSSMKL